MVDIKSKSDIEKMRVAGKLASDVLVMIGSYVKSGVSTLELDQICHDYIVEEQSAIPAPLNYRGFPKSICTSINHVVCHGIPGPRKLINGDILNIDVTVILDGWYGDTSRMFGVGKVNVKATRLMDITYECLMRGISEVKPGATLGDIGYAIQKYAEAERCSVVRDFCGHGLGRVFHSAPSVLHYGKKGIGTELKKGMFFSITITASPVRGFLPVRASRCLVENAPNPLNSTLLPFSRAWVISSKTVATSISISL